MTASVEVPPKVEPDDDSPSYADTFFGFEDINQNEAVVNLLVLLLQNINEKIDVENERTQSILDALANKIPGKRFFIINKNIRNFENNRKIMIKTIINPFF